MVVKAPIVEKVDVGEEDTDAVHLSDGDEIKILLMSLQDYATDEPLDSALIYEYLCN